MKSMIVRKCFGLPVAVALVAVWFASDASGQMFGNRSVGRAVEPRPTPAAGQERSGPAMESIGTIVDDSARYLRGNRAATDFVGSDAANGSRFVGMSQAGTGEALQSAVDDTLRVETTAEQVNRLVEPVIPPRLRLNAPRLELGFAARPQPTQQVQLTAVQRLHSTLPSLDPDSFEVLVADGVTTLRGSVASERDRRMAELLLSFEPGIGRIQNELTVTTQDPLPTLELTP